MGRLQLLMALALLGTLNIINTEAHGCPDKFKRVGSRCLHISTRYLDEERPWPLSWEQSQEVCRGMTNNMWTADLVSNYDAHFLRLMSMEIVNHPGLFQDKYIYWVGATNVNGVWQWLDGTPIDVMSYIWYITDPKSDVRGSHALLVPSGPEGKRHYTYEYPPNSFAPSFICEAKPKSKKVLQQST